MKVQNSGVFSFFIESVEFHRIAGNMLWVPVTVRSIMDNGTFDVVARIVFCTRR